jgi:hypothetical protein
LHPEMSPGEPMEAQGNHTDFTQARSCELRCCQKFVCRIPHLADFPGLLSGDRYT